MVDLGIDGEVITITEDQLFWNATDDEWQRADQLDAGDKLLTAEGRTLQVGKLRPATRRQASSYNLEIADIHTYHVLADTTPVLVHNSNSGCGAESWTSSTNLDDNFDNHGADMGFDSVAEYGYAAEDFMCECDRRRPGVEVKRDSSTLYFLDPETGEFGVRGKKGIVTYYISDNPRRYINDQRGAIVP